MKPSQRPLYAQKIDRVLRHLEGTDLSEIPNSEALAAVAAMSAYHFQRIYRLMTGETLGDTIKRIRLARALPELVAQGSVSEATGAAGYATSQALARALKAATGHTASDIRGNAEAQGRLEETLRRPTFTDTPPPTPVEIVAAEPLRLMAVRNVGAYAELNAAYNHLFEIVFSKWPMEALQGLYGLPSDDPRFVVDADCVFEAAIAIDDPAPLEDIHVLEIAGGYYARQRHQGNFDHIYPAVDALYEAVIDAGHQIADMPLYLHYLDDPEEVPEAYQRTDIYLPLIS
ncbi:AraC family transcriptional regulator [Asticcacaulis benevestitus]|uniref:HTH araC/xylS-type domain-containing protein n=1 Tax=Asticcacaulis benevestitus DSM 16100 = ATCC BAA-896 TaxID=1121022 RepID=V4PV65_9CAUL|nr:GyrI-like domain-containing protein [Asticcacaulis benevestitus]ESQ92241.1 hypothetical protein ABENE_08750 [Asticcacaulis benevestitus DSM 16100 = ATCC BAA-896]